MEGSQRRLTDMEKDQRRRERESAPRTPADGMEYDDFGNLIGGSDGDALGVGERNTHDAGSIHDDASDDEGDGAPGVTNQMELMHVDEEAASNAVVLHEDKQYYPTASQVYGPDVETLVQEEDTQTLAQPIVAPVEKETFTVEEESLPNVTFDRKFMADLMSFPDQVRNVALCGHLHHGKTSLMDTFVEQTHDVKSFLDGKTGKAREEQMRYTDTHILERQRKISVKSSPMSLVMPDIRGKSKLLNIIDTPGHVDFSDEIAASLRLVDGVVLVVDVIEGVQKQTEMIIKHCVLNDLPMVLVLNKIDRLIIELHVEPSDAYMNINNTIESVNECIENVLPGQKPKTHFNPGRNNVIFASASMGWSFTLHSFAQAYKDWWASDHDFDVEQFALRMWGDIYHDKKTGKLNRITNTKDFKGDRSFVHFVLKPIYKLHAHTIAKAPKDLKVTLEKMNIYLTRTQLKLNAKELLRVVCQKYFGHATGFVESAFKHLPTPAEGAKQKVANYYTGPKDTATAKSMLECNADGPLVVQVTKLFPTTDAEAFNCFGRVLSGTVKPNQPVHILGEEYTSDDPEDMVATTLAGVSIAESRYNVPVGAIPAGNLCLLHGIDNSIIKSAAILSPELPDNDEGFVFTPITHFYEPVLKIAIEPVNPSELPKMLEGLRSINKTYPMLESRVEESGEHIMLGSGELYLDCVMHDLRRLYGRMDIKVSDPVTRFAETVDADSRMKCYSITPNKKNRITLVAGPMDDAIAEDIETGKVNIKDPVRVVGKFFEEKHDFDLLASRNIWAFGPTDKSPNILQNDTLPSQIDAKTARAVKDSMTSGFKWGVREGPLCEEPIRNTLFKITDLELDQSPIHRGAGQIIPTARRAVYSSFLMAEPRLMEPVYSANVLCHQDVKGKVYESLSRRRGHVLADTAVKGSPLQRVTGLIPVIDSFGFEVDLKVTCKGTASLSLVFDRWSQVPGDPLDKTAITRPLEPANVAGMARDFVMKTRKRKGLSDDLRVTQFLERDLVKELREGGLLEEDE
ncbi:hypothetical protein MBLNU230_g4716t1 [Neophaeotheca triangularis]